MLSQDSTRSIGISAAKFLSGTLLSRITGYLRDVSLAYAFGTDPFLASFFVAFRFSHLARRLLGEGSMQQIFIPHFEELRREDPKRAARFFADTSLSLLLLLSALVALVSLLLLPFSDNEIVYLTLLMLPSLFFICLFGLNAALLECERHYFLPGIAPLFFNLVWIIAALSLASFPVEQAVYGLSIAVILACAAQWAATLLPLFKTLKGISFKDLRPFSEEVRKLGKPLLFANAGVAASQINNAIDPLFALYAGSEGPAWLWYAIRIQQLPLALFGIALAGALLPPLSRALKAGNLALAESFFADCSLKIALFTVPISFLLLSSAPSAVALLFGHGSFDSHSILHTSYCLAAYGAGLFPMAWILIAAPALYAKGEFRAPMRASIVSMAANIGLNALFIFALGWGAPSVALATPFAACINLALLKRKLPFRFQSKKVLEILLASGVGLFAAWASDSAAAGIIWRIPASSAEALLDLVREGLVFGGVTYGILAWRGFHRAQ